MDCNKEESIRARDLAEMKMKNNDFEGARRIVLKAQNLCPELENASQMLSICDVHCSAQKLVPGSEKDWYGVLQVAKFADEMLIKKQYRRLALFLHPDKNRFPGAEAAFKLICEANAVLSEPSKKSVYDNKIRTLVRSAQVVSAPYHFNNTSQFKKQYGAENKVFNGFGNMNQYTTQPNSFARQGVFCTSCPFCCMKYQCYRKFVNTTLRCQKCSKNFIGYEMGAQGSQNGIRTESIFKDKGVGRATEVNGNLKAKREVSDVTTEYHGKKGGVCNSDLNNSKKEGRRKTKRKGRSRVSTESSESFDTSSESDLEDVTGDYSFATNLSSGPDHVPRRSSRKRQNISYNEGDDDNGDGDDDDIPRSRKRSRGNKLSEDNGSGQNDGLDGESAKVENQNDLHTDASFSKSGSIETGSVYPEGIPHDKFNCDKGIKAKGDDDFKPNIGEDAVQVETDSDKNACSGDNSDNEYRFECDDPEFNDFEKDRDISCFARNQIWACYDSVDGMPRFYAKVKKVRVSPFLLWITWLEADPADDTLKKWIDEELPIGCGNFRIGETQIMPNCFPFAHQMHWEKGGRDSLIIFPRRGEVWALFKDWDLNWSSQPESHREFKYEVVEVQSDFDAVAGLRVCYLDKVEGFVSLFQRSSQSVIGSVIIRPTEIYKFSHCIRSFKMTGSEREGVPVGCFELDPAALPLNPDHLYYPAKSKMEKDNMEPGINCPPPKSGTGEGDSGIQSEGV